MSRRTALVTGASSGLGEAFARELAAHGQNLVLVARRAERLRTLAQELTAAHGVTAEVLPADLTRPEELAKVTERLADGLPAVDLLVNNAGVLGRIAPIADQDPDDQAALVDLDVQATVRLTAAAARAMTRRGAGRIVNVSSMTGFLPVPRGAAYGAAKAFVTAFSENVHCETTHLGVHVTAVCPGSVGTGLHQGSGAKGRLGRNLDPLDVVRQALAAVEAGRPLCVPGRDYRLKALLATVLPRALVRRAVLSVWQQERTRR
ncbi:SDR family NAD(P)-dependent oxidoreductase [Streptomyces sp. GD-15H]|uniref:SDR family NAD(P)-dependent oxidoreductase n=1 Tax=Streptomyces sp. GD-15H TaxID=3129112 RepID=UPI0032477991